MNLDLAHYLSLLTFNVTKRSQPVATPHRPVLLLSIFKSISTGTITTNQVFPDAALEKSYVETWGREVRDRSLRPNLAGALWQLKAETDRAPIWQLLKPDGSILTHPPKSFQQLREQGVYGAFEEELWALLCGEDSFNSLRGRVLSYFHMPLR